MLEILMGSGIYFPNPLQTVEKPAALGFFDKGILALRGAFGNGSGK